MSEFHQARISEGQTAVFAYPSEFSGGKSKAGKRVRKGIVCESFEKSGEEGAFSE
jgi:hypothetical protein